MGGTNRVFVGPAERVSPISKEAKAGASPILPGSLVTLSAGLFVNVATAGQGGDFYIADMNSLEQQPIDVAIPAGGVVRGYVPEVGCTYTLVLAAGQTVAYGTLLTVDASGNVIVAATDGTQAVLFAAEEAVTTTASTDFIRARYTGATIN